MNIDLQLFEWQKDAVTAWERNGYLGTLDIFTGGGKSLIALYCFKKIQQKICQNEEKLQLVIVVPTIALAYQWRTTILKHTDIEEHSIGLLGDGYNGSILNHNILVATINSAYKHLPNQSKNIDNPLMVIVDECHRAGAKQFSKVLNIRTSYWLGLSATPEREEEDDDGFQINYAEQITGQKIGSIVFEFSLKKAREIGWLPDFKIYHHGLQLSYEDDFRYQKLTKRIRDLLIELETLKIPSNQARKYVDIPGKVGELARAYCEALLARKHLLYQASERKRITKNLIQDILLRKPQAKIILFHERKDHCDELLKQLQSELPKKWSQKLSIEHSGLPKKIRQQSLEDFRTGKSQILISVKTLVEGIDVPDADVGIVIASSSSIRQRIQTFGRILRRSFDPTKIKEAEMNLLYVQDSVDENIYGKLDWSDLTSASNNRYFRWLLDAANPEEMDAPPIQPRLLENVAFLQLQKNHRGVVFPQEWKGEIPNQRFLLNSQGVLKTLKGKEITNPQSILSFVQKHKGFLGGSVWVSPKHNLIIIKEEQWKVIGQITDKLTNNPNIEIGISKDFEFLDLYTGPDDNALGTWKNIFRGIRLEKWNGKVYRRRYFAEESTSDELKQRNWSILRNRCNEVESNGLEFHINALGDAYFFNQNGDRVFLARVVNGLKIQI